VESFDARIVAPRIQGVTEIRKATNQANNHCPACGRAGRPFGIKDSYSLVVCSGCSTVHTLQFDAEAEIDDLYDSYYDNAKFTTSAAAERSLAMLVESCEGYRKTGNWLDVGFGEGGLLEIVGSRNWRCFGTEVSKRALDFGTDRGWIVARDARKDPRFPEQGFDVITLIELIEHVADAAEMVRSITPLLRPGGLLYLTTPNVSSINCKLLGIDWSVFSPPEHLTIWSASGIRTILSRMGFNVIRVRTEGLNPKELIDRLRPRNDAPPSQSRNDVAFALNTAMTSTPSRLTLKRRINDLLTWLGMGDSLKVWAVRGSKSS
jgi:2-polyprenyl-3-methyl-5-hydroxy-6-metoxy-1,4-benzoquinol methylase